LLTTPSEDSSEEDADDSCKEEDVDGLYRKKLPKGSSGFSALTIRSFEFADLG
jgi:hypothetical protein